VCPHESRLERLLTMHIGSARRRLALPAAMVASVLAAAQGASAASCNTQSQMTAPQRDSLQSTARTIVTEIQSGQLEAVQADTLPAVAANFSGIRGSMEYLRPMVQSAAVTVDELYVLDASGDPATAQRTDFFCGSPVVVFHFTNLPPAMYALAIVHATGVPQPQQISLVLARSGGDRWMLAGFFSKPMLEAGHDGLWYWVSARKYAQTKMDWAAWLYYRVAANLLEPLDFLSSPNLEKLQHESDQARPATFPGQHPITLNVGGVRFSVTAIDTTTTFGPLDLDVHYTPDPTQTAQLRDPPAARQQVTGIMAALLELHPELGSAFHGIWVHADQGNATLFALELPMNQIAAVPQPTASSSAAR
jgi:hypothetical protein